MNTRGNWWGNLASTKDADIQRINEMEAALGDVPHDARDVRLLISRLEMCHHKVPRHIDVIVEAIGRGKTDTVPVNTYPCPAGAGPTSEQERWRDLADVLGMWSDGVPEEEAVSRRSDLEDEVRDFYARLGEPTELKCWQVGHLEHRILDHVTREVTYRYIVEDEPAQEFRRLTQEQRLLVKQPADLSLAVAIDNCEPCNWRFEDNLHMVLDTIGGHASEGDFFAAHGTNVAERPFRDEAARIVAALNAWAAGEDVAESESWIAASLGVRTPVKAWLAASLAKTISLQMQL